MASPIPFNWNEPTSRKRRVGLCTAPATSAVTRTSPGFATPMSRAASDADASLANERKALETHLAEPVRERVKPRPPNRDVFRPNPSPALLAS